MKDYSNNNKLNEIKEQKIKAIVILVINKKKNNIQPTY